MNFLQLVQRLHSEAGLQGTAPASIVSQSGTALRLVNWINTAYEEIQDLYESWMFRRDDFSFSTIASTQNYTPTGVSITDLAAWWFNPDHNELSGIRLYQSASDEVDLIYIPWDEFRATYKFGALRSQTGRPTIFSVKPDLSIDLWPIPDGVYTVNGEYVKQAATMSANDDEPLFKVQQMIIVWKAMMLYGGFEGAIEAYDRGEQGYANSLAKLEFNQLPKMTFGAPLA